MIHGSLNNDANGCGWRGRVNKRSLIAGHKRSERAGHSRGEHDRMAGHRGGHVQKARQVRL